MKYNAQDIHKIEQSALAQGDAEETYGWVPLPITIFERLMDAATKDAHPNAFFLEPGSGVGTKLFTAREKYNLWEYGVEADYAMIDFAKEKFGVRCYPGDVFHVPYEMADITYISRPFKDDAREVEYELAVHRQIRPGTVLIAAWAAVKPPWHILYREGGHGVWRKPLPGEPVPERAVPAEHPNTVPEYRAMIRRQEPHDPLVKEPLNA